MPVDVIENGNIFNSKCDALVNPVNCVGVMGAGLAKAFKKEFPYYYIDYKEKCMVSKVKIGHVDIYYNGNNMPKFLISLPTKLHWKNPSKLEYIEKGIESLKEKLKTLRINSVATPALGCGLGGLEWEDVLPIIKKLDSPDIKLEIYKPWN